MRAFLQRADEALESTLARRADLLTLGRTINAHFENDGTNVCRISREHASHDELVAAATAVRPFFLAKEPVHYVKVLDAGQHLGGPRWRRHYREARSKWDTYGTADSWKMARADTNSGEWMTDRELAHNWFYGFVWHNDKEKRESIAAVPKGERLLAATVYATDAVLLVAATRALLVDSMP